MNLLLLIVNGSLIAGIYALAKITGEAGVSSVGMLAWQLLFSAPVITAIAIARGQGPRFDAASIRYAAIAGTLGISAPSLITFSALAHVPAGLIGVIGALSPVFTYAIVLALRVERPRAVRAAGIALGLAGVLSVLLPRGALPGMASLPWAFAALGGPFLLAAGNVFRSLAWPRGLQPLTAASLTLIVQALAVVPVAVGLGEFEPPKIAMQPHDVALIAGGALTCGFYLTAFELQKRAGPVAVGQLGYVITIVSLAIGTLAFGERYPATTLIAVAVVFAGVMLVQRSNPGAQARPKR